MGIIFNRGFKVSAPYITIQTPTPTPTPTSTPTSTPTPTPTPETFYILNQNGVIITNQNGDNLEFQH